MNFSIHIDDRLGRELKREAARTKKPRNALVTEAIRQWLETMVLENWRI